MRSLNEDCPGYDKEMESRVKECNELRCRIDALERKVELLSDMMSRLSGGFRDLSEATRYSNYMTDDADYDTKEVVTECACEVDTNVSPIAVPVDENNQTDLAPLEKDGSDSVMSSSFNYEIRYLGSPSGSGFEVMNERDSMSVNSFYILEIDRERCFARFYPNVANSKQLVLERANLLDPVCEIVGEPLNADELNVAEENYGELQLCGDYWALVKKCKIVV